MHLKWNIYDEFLVQWKRKHVVDFVKTQKTDLIPPLHIVNFFQNTREQALVRQSNFLRILLIFCLTMRKIS
jgi:hypothetical protein